MYSVLMLVCAAIGVGLFWYGRAKGRRLPVFAGILFALAAVAAFSLLDFWGEFLWFKALGYNDRFWTSITAMLGLSLAGCLFGLGLTWALSLLMPPDNTISRLLTRFFGAFIGIFWGYSHWETWLKFYYGVSTDTTEPLFSKDVGFYLFSLPWLDALHQLLFLLALILFIGGIVQFLQVVQSSLAIRNVEDARKQNAQFKALYTYAAFLLLVFALGAWLERYHLLYSEMGVVHGPGWTDIHIRLPMYWLIIVIYLLLAAVFLFRSLLNPLQKRFRNKGLPEAQSRFAVLASAAGLIVVVIVLTQNLAPRTLQWLRVEPNEITFEEPYIKRNIDFTRQAFKLDNVEEREFQASETFTSDMVQRNQNIFSNIRLWDWRALDSVYKQFQEIRLYYEFNDVDIDRYTFGDAYREVMVSAREMEIDNLSEQSQTFVNRRFKYTHGYGIIMNNVSEFTEQGLPNLLIKDIPPQSSYPELEVDRPEIYYGELTRGPAVVNTREKEFDYPKGEQNAYIRYPDQMLQVQGLVYAKYHMTDPTVFYNQEDLWVRATEKYHNRVQPVQPYYIMWEQPETDNQEFVLIQPFTPKNRQVLIGWIAGMCDGENYGRLLTYKFPKEKRILGPQQVETKIDQDSYLSGQLTLWDQRGSNVIRGNVLAIPIEETLIYVEPIYLQAETAAYPELRLVVLMHNDRLSYAETFDKALEQLLKAGRPSEEALPAITPGTGNIDQLVQQANQAFENYLRLQGEMNFEQASKELKKLHTSLQQLKQRTAESDE